MIKQLAMMAIAAGILAVTSMQPSYAQYVDDSGGSAGTASTEQLARCDQLKISRNQCTDNTILSAERVQSAKETTYGNNPDGSGTPYFRGIHVCRDRHPGCDLWRRCRRILYNGQEGKTSSCLTFFYLGDRIAYCIGACAHYKSRTLEESRLRYAYGDKWCCYCSVFIKWNGRDCRCCKTRLRTRPVRSKNLVTIQ